jgi:heat shock protein HslJ
MNEPYPDEYPPDQSQGQPEWVKVFAVVIGIAFVLLVIGALAYAVANNTTTPEVKSFIDLTSPADGATLDANQIIVVSGIAGVSGGTLMVQALDTAGTILGQQPAAVNSANAAAGEPGTWIAQLTINIPLTVAGRLRAYAVSPVDGLVIAEDSIGVTFNKPTVIQSYIKIQQPSNGAQLDTSAPIIVTGDAAGLYEGGLVVQALDQNGAVLTQAPTSINAPQAGLGMAGQWSVALNVTGVTSGSAGQIFAFSNSAADGSVIAQDRVNITYTAKIQPFISISEPVNGAVLNPANPIRVSGKAGSLPGNQVMVQLQDQFGNVLTQQPGPLDAQGNWFTQLQVNVTQTAPVTIIAYATNPADNSLVTQTSVAVTLGVAPTGTAAPQITASSTATAAITGLPPTFPTETPPPQPSATPVPPSVPTPAPIPPEASNYLWILRQLNGQVPVSNSLITLKFKGYIAEGFAGCNTYSASVQYSGTSLILANIAFGKKACSSPPGVMQQESAYLNSLSLVKWFRVEQGQLLLLDQSGQLILGYQAGVIGRIYGPEGAVIPAGSQVLTAITNASTGAVLSKQPQTNFTVFPIPFAVAYEPAGVDPNQTYTIQVRITDASGNTLYATNQVYNVITQGNPSYVDVAVTAP